MSLTWSDPEDTRKRRPEPSAPLFEQAQARRSDPATSKAAAASVVNLGRTRDQILWLLRMYGPLTDEQIAERHDMQVLKPKASPSGLRSRRSELVRLGFIEDSGKTAPTSSGRQSTIWRLAR